MVSKGRGKGCYPLRFVPTLLAPELLAWVRPGIDQLSHREIFPGIGRFCFVAPNLDVHLAVPLTMVSDVQASPTNATNTAPVVHTTLSGSFTADSPIGIPFPLDVARLDGSPVLLHGPRHILDSNNAEFLRLYPTQIPPPHHGHLPAPEIRERSLGLGRMAYDPAVGHSGSPFLSATADEGSPSFSLLIP